jgi:hypothetical protein
MDQLLRFALNAFGHFIQNIGGLMDPATLLGDWTVFFLQRNPEAQRSVTDSQFGRGQQTQALELPKQFSQDWVLSR